MVRLSKSAEGGGNNKLWKLAGLVVTMLAYAGVIQW
jgi:hypothetical protein